MNIVPNLQTYSASEARDKLYTLIKTAGTKLSAYEITLRGSEPVILINKAELEEWQETLDILCHKSEIISLRKARKQKKLLTHKQMLKAIGLADET